MIGPSCTSTPVGIWIPCARQPLKHQLAGEIIIHAILEDDRDGTQTDLGNRAHFGELRQTSQFDFNRSRDQLLHVWRRHAARRGQHLHLHVGHVRECVNRDLPGDSQPKPVRIKVASATSSRWRTEKFRIGFIIQWRERRWVSAGSSWFGRSELTFRERDWMHAHGQRFRRRRCSQPKRVGRTGVSETRMADGIWEEFYGVLGNEFSRWPANFHVQMTER